MAPEPDASDTTEDAVLGGRLRLRQPRRGHRVGHDAILLAAATPARAGERVVDLGAGVGAAGLALAKRVEGVHLTLVEIDRALCALAHDNVRLNGLDGRVDVVARDVAELPADEFGSAERVLMNPPFNDSARLQLSPDPARRLAYAASADTLGVWIGAAIEEVLRDLRIAVVERHHHRRHAVRVRPVDIHAGLDHRRHATEAP